MQDLPALTNQTIYAVQAVAAAMKDDSGAKTGASFVRHGGVNGDGAAFPLSAASQLFVAHIAEKNPNGTVAWTEATVNAMEIGAIVTV